MGSSNLDNPRRPGTALRHRVEGVQRRSGFTTIELLIVIAILAIIGGIVALNLRPLSNHAQNGANAISAGLKQARARAMSTTSAYRLVYVSSTAIATSYANTCASGTWTPEPVFDVTVADSAWFEVKGAPPNPVGTVIACYNTRGFAETSTAMTVHDERGNTRTVEVFVGGGVVVE